MNKVIMLTKAGCTQCAAAKMVLEKVLNNKYQNNITLVQKELDPTTYESLVQQHSILSLPAFISESAVLRDASPSNLIPFLQNILG